MLSGASYCVIKYVHTTVSSIEPSHFSRSEFGAKKWSRYLKLIFRVFDPKIFKNRLFFEELMCTICNGENNLFAYLAGACNCR